MLQIEAWLHDALPLQFPKLLSVLVELFIDHLADWKMKTIPMVRGVLEVRVVLVHSRQMILLRLLGQVFRGTQNQYGRPTPIPSVGDEESNGPGDGSVRRIMASGFRDMKKSMITARVKERDFIKIKELPQLEQRKHG